MWDKAGDVLIGLGLPGLVILALVGVILYQERSRREDLEREREESKQRLADNTLLIQALEKSSEALLRSAKATEDNNRAIENLSRSIAMIGGPRGLSA